MGQAANDGDGLFQQVIVVALPGLGAGAQHDAGAYRDRGASTLEHVSTYVGGVELPNLSWLGLGNVARVRGVEPASPPAASHGVAERKSAGGEAEDALTEALGAAVETVAGLGRQVLAVGGAARVFERTAGVEEVAVGARELLVEAVVQAMHRHPGALIVAAPEPGRGLAGAGPVGVARALVRFDASLSGLLDQVGEETLVIVCGLGGQDATLGGRDDGPTREVGPVLVYAPAVPSGVDLGSRLTLADVGATAAEVFGATHTGPGRSFLSELLG